MKGKLKGDIYMQKAIKIKEVNMMQNLIKDYYKHKHFPVSFILPIDENKEVGSKIQSFISSLEEDLEMKFALKKIFDEVVGHALGIEFKHKNYHQLAKARKIVLEAILCSSEIRELVLNVASQCFLHWRLSSVELD